MLCKAAGFQYTTMVKIGFASLELADIEKVILGEKVEISDETRKRVEESFNFLKDFSRNKIIYGINTGFGPMAQYKIEESEQIQLQHQSPAHQHARSVFA